VLAASVSRTKRLPGVSLERPVDPEPRQAGRCLAGRGWIDFRGGEHVGERIEVVANAQAPLDTGLEGHRSSTRERVEDHVPGRVYRSMKAWASAAGKLAR